MRWLDCPAERAKTVKKLFQKYFTDVWNVPNVLTMLRLALIPVFVALFATGHDKLALLVFLIASFTDFLDGYLARRNNQITAFGKLMDPLADKVMVVTALICQGIVGVFPWSAIVIVLLKELIMILGGVVMLKNDVVVYSNLLGKTAQCFFIAALVLSFYHAEFLAWGFPLDRVILWLSVILTLCALVDYGIAAIKTLRSKNK